MTKMKSLKQSKLEEDAKVKYSERTKARLRDKICDVCDKPFTGDLIAKYCCKACNYVGGRRKLKIKTYTCSYNGCDKEIKATHHRDYCTDCFAKVRGNNAKIARVSSPNHMKKKEPVRVSINSDWREILK